MQIESCKDMALWDRFVEAAPGSSNYHRWRWGQAISRTWGHETYPLIASAGGVVRGVLPLVFIRSHLFGRSLVSMPFFSYGGVLANCPETRDALLRHAVELGSDLKVRHIELRSDENACDAAEWAQVSNKLRVDVKLPPVANDLWMSLSAKLRKRIRYASNHGLTTAWGGVESLDEFYKIFATNMRNLGTPVYPISWFRNLFACSPGDIRILIVRDGAVPVAGAFVIAYRNCLELPWAASLPDARDKFSPLLMYWTLLEWAIENGFERVDLGRCTPESGNHQFKRHWSSLETPLRWHHWVAPGQPAPNFKREDSRYQWPIRIWKHLPLAVANRLGPRLVRALP